MDITTLLPDHLTQHIMRSYTGDVHHESIKYREIEGDHDLSGTSYPPFMFACVPEYIIPILPRPRTLPGKFSPEKIKYENYGVPWSMFPYIDALALNGHIKCIGFILKHYFWYSMEMFSDGENYGSKTNTGMYYYTMTPLTNAMEYGDLNSIKWLYKRGCRRGNIFTIAAAKGNLDVIKWLFELRGQQPAPNSTTIDAAIKYGDPENITWLLENNFPCTDRARLKLIELGLMKK